MMLKQYVKDCIIFRAILSYRLNASFICFCPVSVDNMRYSSQLVSVTSKHTDYTSNYTQKIGMYLMVIFNVLF